MKVLPFILGYCLDAIDSSFCSSPSPSPSSLVLMVLKLDDGIASKTNIQLTRNCLYQYHAISSCRPSLAS